VLPNSRGGGSTLENVVVTCAPCNFGRMETTLAEARLTDPLSRPTARKWSGFDRWDGLERFGARPRAMSAAGRQCPLIEPESVRAGTAPPQSAATDNACRSRKREPRAACRRGAGTTSLRTLASTWATIEWGRPQHRRWCQSPEV